VRILRRRTRGYTASNTIVLYNEAAQRIILDNLEAILRGKVRGTAQKTRGSIIPAQ
jgi:hypothetical protein